MLWVQARFFVVELPLAIEDNIDGTSTIGRSWELTKGHAWRIVAILFVGYLITIPIQIPFAILSTIIQLALGSLVQENRGYDFIPQLVNLIMNLISAALVVPFWQSIKAVVYYDLRSRREGMGLKLRDREI
jgi:membrane-anchored glycerophosphoryl diester phosphodiesterase (GDPDase)